MSKTLLLGLLYNFSETLSPEAEAVVAVNALVAELHCWVDGLESDIGDCLASLGRAVQRLEECEEKTSLSRLLPMVEIVYQAELLPQGQLVLSYLREAGEQLNGRVADAWEAKMAA